MLLLTEKDFWQKPGKYADTLRSFSIPQDDAIISYCAWPAQGSAS